MMIIPGADLPHRDRVRVTAAAEEHWQGEIQAADPSLPRLLARGAWIPRPTDRCRRNLW